MPYKDPEQHKRMHKEFSRRHYLANKAKYRESCLRWRAKVRQNASNPAVVPITASPSLETTIQPAPIVPVAPVPVPEWYLTAKRGVCGGLSSKWASQVREQFFEEVQRRVKPKLSGMRFVTDNVNKYRGLWG